MNAGKSALVKKKAKVASVFNMDSSEDEEQVDNGPITIEKLVGKTQKIEDFGKITILILLSTYPFHPFLFLFQMNMTLMVPILLMRIEKNKKKK